MYGDSDGAPLGEGRSVGFGSPERTRFTYAAGKAAGEALAFAYATEYALPVVVGRFFNVTGPLQHSEFGAVVPTVVEPAVAGGPLTVHGDGTQTRAFLDVRDAAEYVWRLLRIAPQGGLLVNIGRDAVISILELARRVRALVDPALEIRLQPAAYGEGFAPIHHRRPDVRRLLEWTSYDPRESLDATLQACVDSLTQRR